MRSEIGRSVAGRQPLFVTFFSFILNTPAERLSGGLFCPKNKVMATYFLIFTLFLAIFSISPAKLMSFSVTLPPASWVQRRMATVLYTLDNSGW